MRVLIAPAARLSGCTRAQLAAWARVGLVTPAADGTYDFRSLVALRLVRSLLDAGLSLPKVKRSLGYLRASGEDLAELRIVTDGDRVWACHDDGQILDALGHGQLALFVALDRFVVETEAEIAAFRAEREAFVAALEPDAEITGSSGGDAANAS